MLRFHFMRKSGTCFSSFHDVSSITSKTLNLANSIKRFEAVDKGTYPSCFMNRNRRYYKTTIITKISETPSDDNRYFRNSLQKDTIIKKKHVKKEILEAKTILNDLRRNRNSNPKERSPPSNNPSITLLQLNTALIKLCRLSTQNRGSNIESAQLAQTILQEIETPIDENEKDHNGHQKTNHHLLVPNDKTYNAVLNCWAKSGGGVYAARKAEQLLNMMISRYLQSRKNRKISASKNNRTKSSFRANNINNIKHENMKLDVAIPDIISFHSVMNAWAKSADLNAGKKTQQLLKRMMDLKDLLKINAPTPQTYAIILEAWANSGSNEAAERATDILNHLINELHHGSVDDENNVVHLTTAAFNSVIKAWKRSEKGAYSAQRAEEILIQMEELNLRYTRQTDNHSQILSQSVFSNTRSYNFVLDAWAKSKETQSVKRVEALLERMHKLYQDGYDVKPNQISYTIAINTLARSGERGAALRAEAILEKMIKYHINDTTDNTVLSPLGASLKPTTATFSAVIDAWSRSGEKDSGFRAESILNRFLDLGTKGYDIDVKPSVTTFNSTITAWARSGDASAGEKAEALINRMKYENLYPDVVTFNALINAYGNSKDVSMAESVLDRMNEIYENNEGDEYNDKRNIRKVKPNIITYNTLIGVYAKSDMKGKAKKAGVLFSRLIANNNNNNNSNNNNKTEPNVVTYYSLLKACALTSTHDPNEAQEALTIAMDTFDHLKRSKNVSANNKIYRVMIDVCANLIFKRSEHDKFLQEILDQCCKGGYLDESVLYKIHRMTSPDTFHKMIGTELVFSNGKCSVENLPLEWSKHQKKS